MSDCTYIYPEHEPESASTECGKMAATVIAQSPERNLYHIGEGGGTAVRAPPTFCRHYLCASETKAGFHLPGKLHSSAAATGRGSRDMTSRSHAFSRYWAGKQLALLTLGAHAQRGLQYWVCQSFRPSVRYPLFCHYAQQGGQKALPTGLVPHWFDF